MLYCHARGRRVWRALHDKSEHPIASSSIHFLDKTATGATLLGDDGLRQQLLEQLLGTMRFVVHKMVLWKSCSGSCFTRLVAVENAEPALIVLPIVLQLADGVDTGKSNQALDIMLVELANCIVIVAAPHEIGIVGRENAVHAN